LSRPGVDESLQLAIAFLNSFSEKGAHEEGDIDSISLNFNTVMKSYIDEV